MRKYIVIGNPIDHSLSPMLHNYWIKNNNIKAVYEKHKLGENEIKNLILEIREKKIHGVNVTVPFKRKIIPYLDDLSLEAKKTQSIVFPYIIGLAFGFGWTPCIGPILGSILALAAIEETLGKAVFLLILYSLGLALPFILSGYLIQKFLLFSKNFKKNINLISKLGGIILLITGILILTDQLQAIGFYIIEIFPFMQNFG